MTGSNESWVDGNYDADTERDELAPADEFTKNKSIVPDTNRDIDLQRISAEQVDTMKHLLTYGATIGDAIAIAGVSRETFDYWMERGELDKSGTYHEFYLDIRRAEAQARVNYLMVLARSAQAGDWRAALAYLKARDPKSWSGKVPDEDGRKHKRVVVIEVDQ